jgi:uncharacterized membrane-anchored protein
MHTEYKKLGIGLFILLGMLAGYGLYVSYPLITGVEATLATQPIDPFDPLRGQYITIRYEISTVTGENLSVGDEVYVSLKDDAEGIARFTKTSIEKPAKGMFIKGKVESVSGNRATVRYGIEQYFFERGAQFSTQNLQVKVKIDSSGQARIKELMHEGKPVEMNYRNLSYKS